MWRVLSLALCAVGCASAGPPEPRTVERVVYVSSPCPAPVIVQHHGRPPEPRGDAPRKRNHPSVFYPSVAMRKHAKHDAKRKKLAKRCDKKSTPEARERCHRDVARR
jgi:hypothetical protein